MAGRVRAQSLAAALLVPLTVAAAAGIVESKLLVRYSFDDHRIETGPDTFRVFENAKGTVTLISAYRMSGYHSVEIRDVAGDGDFPELQGYFPLRRKGMLYVHFAFLVTDPRETLNIALAGPAWFHLAKDGIGFWLRTQDGRLYHVSDSIPKRLFRVDPFTWYRVDLAYDLDRGRYDLSISEEQRLEQLVFLQDQPNAANQPGSALDKFSFIGDRGTDTSNVHYYVDDVVVSADEVVRRIDFVAPGRRKLFFERELAIQNRLRGRPACLPVTEFSDLGIAPAAARAMLQSDLSPVLRGYLRGDPGPRPSGGGPETLGLEPDWKPLLAGLALWTEGCQSLSAGDAEGALRRFDRAAAQVPEASLYSVSAILALAALKHWDEVDARWARVQPWWRSDARYPAVMALLGLARGDLDEVERWLARPMAEASIGFGGADVIGDRLAEQYFHVLLWKERYREAERLALALAASGREAGRSPALWLERAGDAAVYLEDHSAAIQRYEAAREQAPDTQSVLLKLSDLHFLRGDLDRERFYRERIFGSLRGRPAP